MFINHVVASQFAGSHMTPAARAPVPFFAHPKKGTKERVPESPPRVRGVSLRFSSGPAAAELAKKRLRHFLAEFPGLPAMLGGSHGVTGPAQRKVMGCWAWLRVGTALQIYQCVTSRNGSPTSLSLRPTQLTQKPDSVNPCEPPSIAELTGNSARTVRAAFASSAAAGQFEKRRGTLRQRGGESGTLSLVTFFGWTKKVTGSPAGDVIYQCHLAATPEKNRAATKAIANQRRGFTAAPADTTR